LPARGPATRKLYFPGDASPTTSRAEARALRVLWVETRHLLTDCAMTPDATHAATFRDADRRAIELASPVLPTDD
jgi:hypothetical protein